jgi:SAM-dependent methyltransferase
LPEFVVMVFAIKITLLIQLVMIPAFWKARAQQIVDEGHLDSSTKGSGGQRLVLEIGCNEGKISAIFARAIAARQEASNSNTLHASLPIFIGYDKWSAWSRIPNSPACFLTTLMNAGVPRECVIANRMDTTSKAAKTTLPYASDSISLIICSFGLSELILLSRVDRGTLFRELVRALEPEGRVVLVERGDGGNWGRRFWKGPVGSYQRILLEEMGWPRENAVVRWDRGFWYMVAVKPSGTGGTV